MIALWSMLGCEYNGESLLRFTYNMTDYRKSLAAMLSVMSIILAGT